MTDRTLRPLHLGDIFDEAFDLYKGNFFFFVLITALTTVPLTIVTALLTLKFSREYHQLSNVLSGGFANIDTILSTLGTVIQGLAVFAPLYLIGHGLQMTALAAAASTRYLGEPATLRGAYRVPFKHMGALIGVSLLYGLANGFGFMFCYVGMVLPLTKYIFTAHAFANEGAKTGYWRAMKRSANLVSGYGGRVFGALCVLACVYAILSIGISLPLKYALDTLLNYVPGVDKLVADRGGSGDFSIRGQILDQMSGGISWLVLAPFLISVVTVLYFDLRVRKEAFDIELLAHRLQFPVPSWPAASAAPREGSRDSLASLTGRKSI